MQILFRAPDGVIFFSEEDCLSYEEEKTQEYWDRVRALRALSEASAAVKARRGKNEGGSF